MYVHPSRKRSEGCAERAVKENEEFETDTDVQQSKREEITMSTELIILIVVLVLLFGGGGGYYWSRRG